MSTQQQTNLPSEIWENKPQSPSPFNKTTAQNLLDYKAQLEAMSPKSDFFKLGDGEEMEIYFNMSDPRVGIHKRKLKDKKTGEEKEIEGMHFIVWNTKEDCEQLWTPSRTTSLNALEFMERYNTNAIIVKRTGKELDTKYTFFLPNPKRATDL